MNNTLKVRTPCGTCIITVGNNQKVSARGIGELPFTGSKDLPPQARPPSSKHHLQSPCCSSLHCCWSICRCPRYWRQSCYQERIRILEAILQNNLFKCTITPVQVVSSLQTPETCLLTRAAPLHRRFVQRFRRWGGCLTLGMIVVKPVCLVSFQDCLLTKNAMQ